LRRRGERAKQERRRTARFGGDGESLQLGIARLIQPGAERVAASRVQRLLARPKRIAPVRRLHDEDVCKIDSTRRPGGRIRNVRRRDEDHVLARSRQPGEYRNQDAKLADARLVNEELGETLSRPAASGKLGIECRETARLGTKA